MDNINLSIIVPVYNLERFISPLLFTLKHQDLAGYVIEIIFVLNNCTDKSEDMIRDSGIECRIINCKQQGCGPARNAGMDIASGEYIWFMDGDDWLKSDKAIKEVLDRAMSQNLDILRIPFDQERFGGNYFSMVWQYLFRREFINEFRFPDYQPSEDDAFMHQVLYKAGYNWRTYLNMPCIDHDLYYYNYLREGSNMYRHNILHENI